MPHDPPREQEQSIKERKNLLYEDDPSPISTITRKPFQLYLKETPPAPLSMGVKAMLWGAGVVVGLLLLAAMLRGARGRPRPEKPTGQVFPAISRELLS